MAILTSNARTCVIVGGEVCTEKALLNALIFDATRISQIQSQFVKKQSNGNAPRDVYISIAISTSVDVASGFIYTLGVGLSTLLVSTNWAMREPL